MVTLTRWNPSGDVASLSDRMERLFERLSDKGLLPDADATDDDAGNGS